MLVELQVLMCTCLAGAAGVYLALKLLDLAKILELPAVPLHKMTHLLTHRCAGVVQRLGPCCMTSS